MSVPQVWRFGRSDWQSITDALTNTGTEDEYDAREEQRRQEHEATRGLEQQYRGGEPAGWTRSGRARPARPMSSPAGRASTATAPRRAVCARTANAPAAKKHSSALPTLKTWPAQVASLCV
ncbi:hypothetical protein [Streptomyces yanii]|uniref:hypothetical protein n=1 Tax=Streptomyces yanii TaxID=78510 RepID=UPI0031EA7B2D